MYPERVGNVPEEGEQSRALQREHRPLWTWRGRGRARGQKTGPGGGGQPRGLAPRTHGVCQVCLRASTRVAVRGSSGRPGGKRWRSDLPVPPPDPQPELLSRNLPGVGGKLQGLTPNGGAGQAHGEDAGQRGRLWFRRGQLRASCQCSCYVSFWVVPLEAFVLMWR